MNRRNLLKTSGAVLAAGALSSLPLLSSNDTQLGARQRNTSTRASTGTDEPPPSTPIQSENRTSYRDDIEFDRVVDAVDDLGMDDSGETPIDDVLSANLRNGTLIEFPPGGYLTTERHTVETLSRWGIRGKSGDRSDVRIRTQEGAGHMFLNIRNGRDILVENVSFDSREGRHEWLSNTFKLADGLRFNNVEYTGFYASEVTGRKAEPGRNIEGPLHVHITESTGVGIIDNFVRSGPTHHAQYPAGTSCIFVGPAETVGTLYLQNSHIENMSSHGIYASRTRGNVRIDNCVFKNNNGAGVRISGPGSYIRNSDIVIDRRDVIGGTLGPVFPSVTTGMWFESGFRTQAGGTMDGCRVDISRAPDRTRGIEVDGSAGRTTISNTEVHTGSGDLRPIDINQPGRKGARVRTEGSVPDDPRVDILNVTITGQSSGPEAVIDVTGRDGVTVADTSIDFAGNRDGIRFSDASGYTVTDSSIALTGVGVGILAEDSTDGAISATDVSTLGVPLAVSTSDTPQGCILTFGGENTFESQQYDDLVRVEQPSIAITEGTSNGCLQHEDVFRGGGQVQVLRRNQNETVMLLRN